MPPTPMARVGPLSVVIDRPPLLVWGTCGMYDMVSAVLLPRSHVTTHLRGIPFQVGVSYQHVANGSDGPPVTLERVLLEVDNPTRLHWAIKGARSYHLGDREETFTFESLQDGTATRVTYEAVTMASLGDCCIRCVAFGQNHYDTQRMRMVLGKLKQYLELIDSNLMMSSIQRNIRKGQPRSEEMLMPMPSTAPPSARRVMPNMTIEIPDAAGIPPAQLSGRHAVETGVLVRRSPRPTTGDEPHPSGESAPGSFAGSYFASLDSSSSTARTPAAAADAPTSAVPSITLSPA